jgi:CS domain
MLKRLPLNLRASDYAVRAGFSPPPTFYGNVFLGRVHRTDGAMTRNAPFRLGEDTALDAPWLKAAATDNLNYQLELNHITGRSTTTTQPSVAGTDGTTKQEEGYVWTQTEQELEVIVDNVKDAKKINIKFNPRIVQVFEAGQLLVHLRLFESIDVDGCTWTVEGTQEGTKQLHITMEKGDEALWPRIRD